MSANGQQFSSDDTRFVQYAPPPARTLLPSGGPDLGGTTVAVSGPGLRNGSEYRCRFGRARVEAPALLTLALTLTLTLPLTLTLTLTLTLILTLALTLTLGEA